MLPNTSWAGSCHDNAAMESFWANVKAEFVAGRTFGNVIPLRVERFACLEIFHNRGRLHGALGHQSPVEYRSNLS